MSNELAAHVITVHAPRRHGCAVGALARLARQLPRQDGRDAFLAAVCLRHGRAPRPWALDSATYGCTSRWGSTSTPSFPWSRSADTGAGWFPQSRSGTCPRSRRTGPAQTTRCRGSPARIAPLRPRAFHAPRRRTRGRGQPRREGEATGSGVHRPRDVRTQAEAGRCRPHAVLGRRAIPQTRPGSVAGEAEWTRRRRGVLTRRNHLAGIKVVSGRDIVGAHDR